ncbi:hypothetical protein CVD25_14940 [Bacillus canaveralius]|uniref:KARI N-terminal Rossmann domain-containing protein n=1 Tax=Bacillus canaveralius TaxID=1403243 RepID=A0A2N5GMV7_9BACI|nr:MULTISPECIES: hypothetical protein [Bacillus]PLR82262.1 hypothetical protein CVD23_17275 [Bacillus sp. V33-4]PLR83461.1 hypothetical protein CU635_09195 [Bacillus canaveralius]PLR95358.1 hypothetical protein CVD25_14940 [Bacillus canaveralius]RSK57080.1 hypothetical protein EJA13_01510 [Bacillus canaveralius]
MIQKYNDEMIISYYKNKTVAILGYRSNGGQQRAKLLRDNGIKVLIGLRVGDEYWGQAVNDGFNVYPVWEAAEQAEVAQVW